MDSICYIIILEAISDSTTCASFGQRLSSPSHWLVRLKVARERLASLHNFGVSWCFHSIHHSGDVGGTKAACPLLYLFFIHLSISLISRTTCTHTWPDINAF